MSNYQNLIIDGNNFLFRAYYADIYNKSTGIEKDQSVMRQFFKMLKNLGERFHPEETYFSWDNKLNPDGYNFRNDLADYKGQRETNETVEQILALHLPIQEILDAMGVQTVYPWNLEADDVICWLSKLPGRNLIVSSDKDLLQLINNDVDVLLATKNLLVNVQNFQMNANIERSKFVLYKCILGDTSDNIQGLKGFGPVKAKKLAETLSEKEVFCMDDDKDEFLTTEQWTTIETNYKLVDLNYVPATYPEEIQKYEEQLKAKKVFDMPKLRNLFEQYNLLQFVRQINDFSRLFNKNRDQPIEINLDSIMDLL